MKGQHSCLTVTQRRRLQSALESLNNESVLSVTELEGFLHALVITPDMVKPSEWMPVIFDTDIPEFESEEQQQQVFTAIFDAYNAYEKARTKNRLRFPFDLEMFSQDMLDEIHQWCYGFTEALSLRPDIWFLDIDKKDVKFDDMPEIEQAVAVAVSTIGALAYPEDFIKHLGAVEEIKDNDVVEAISTVISNIPAAVVVLQSYGNNLWEQRLLEMKGGVPDFNLKKKKVGRNEPCPCGSGKKYKKCCGKN